MGTGMLFLSEKIGKKIKRKNGSGIYPIMRINREVSLTMMRNGCN